MFFEGRRTGKKDCQWYGQGLSLGSLRMGYVHILSSINRNSVGVVELPGGREAVNMTF